MDIRSTLLMAFLFSLMLIVGYIVGNGNPYTLFIFFALALFGNLIVFWYGDSIILKMYRAKVLEESEYPELQKMVSRLANNAGIPKPKVALVSSRIPNAFATGRDPSSSAVAVTEGALDALSREELEGVLGHEMAHIKNRDTLVMVLAAAIAGAIGYMAFWARWSLLMGGGGRRNQGGMGIIGLVLIAILVPLAAVMIRMAISRNREYGADEKGAEISGKPGSLASALEKIESIAERKPAKGGNPATGHLFIVNPFRGDAISRLFSSHPPTAKRVDRLRQMERDRAYGRIY